MKILKWFFGISALYGVVELVKRYHAEAGDIKEYAKKEEMSKPMLVVAAIGAVFSIGMEWPKVLFDNVYTRVAGCSLALFEHVKQRGENAYENN